MEVDQNQQEQSPAETKTNVLDVTKLMIRSQTFDMQTNDEDDGTEPTAASHPQLTMDICESTLNLSHQLQLGGTFDVAPQTSSPHPHFNANGTRRQFQLGDSLLLDTTSELNVTPSDRTNMHLNLSAVHGDGVANRTRVHTPTDSTANGILRAKMKQSVQHRFGQPASETSSPLVPSANTMIFPSDTAADGRLLDVTQTMEHNPWNTTELLPTGGDNNVTHLLCAHSNGEGSSMNSSNATVVAESMEDHRMEFDDGTISKLASFERMRRNI